jgi:hypothetical protein
MQSEGKAVDEYSSTSSIHRVFSYSPCCSSLSMLAAFGWTIISALSPPPLRRTQNAHQGWRIRVPLKRERIICVHMDFIMDNDN